MTTTPTALGRPLPGSSGKLHRLSRTAPVGVATGQMRHVARSGPRLLILFLWVHTGRASRRSARASGPQATLDAPPHRPRGHGRTAPAGLFEQRISARYSVLRRRRPWRPASARSRRGGSAASVRPTRVPRRAGQATIAAAGPLRDYLDEIGCTSGVTGRAERRARTARGHTTSPRRRRSSYPAPPPPAGDGASARAASTKRRAHPRRSGSSAMPSPSAPRNRVSLLHVLGDVVQRAEVRDEEPFGRPRPDPRQTLLPRLQIDVRRRRRRERERQRVHPDPRRVAHVHGPRRGVQVRDVVHRVPRV